MPDLTMCCNCDCPYRDKCYRYRAVPDEFWQSYCLFEPYERIMKPTMDKVLECDHFWEIVPGQRIRNTADVDKLIAKTNKKIHNIKKGVKNV